MPLRSLHAAAAHGVGRGPASCFGGPREQAAVDDVLWHPPNRQPDRHKFATTISRHAHSRGTRMSAALKLRARRTGLIAGGVALGLLLLLAIAPSATVDLAVNIAMAAFTPSRPTWDMARGRRELASYTGPETMLTARHAPSTTYNHAPPTVSPEFQQMVNTLYANGEDFPLPRGGSGLDRDKCLAEAPECEWFEYTTNTFTTFPFDLASCCFSHAGRSGMRHILTALAKELNAAGVRWWLEYGTIRGYVRYRQPNAWDDEADIGYALEDHHIMEDKVIPALEAQGYEIKRRPRVLWLPGTMFRGGHTLRYKESSWPADMWSSSQVDLYAFYTSPPSTLWSYVRRASLNWRWRERHLVAPYDTLFPVQPCTFMDTQMSCPNKPAEYVFYETGTLEPPENMQTVACRPGMPEWLNKSRWFTCR